MDSGQIVDDGIYSDDDSQRWDRIEIVKLPPMISRISECKMCYSKEICSLAAISLEAEVPRPAPTGQF